MRDRSESHVLGTSLSEFAKSNDGLSDALVEDGLAPTEVEEADAHAGAWPVLHLTRKPTLTPVPRPHNAAVLASSAFANANLPVVNVHVKRKKLELRGH